MVYSDSHAHMVDYPSEQVKQIIKLMHDKQVDLVLGVGVNLDSSERTIKLAETYTEIKAAIGFHPRFAEKLTGEIRECFETLAGSKFVSAIGEVGLDYAPPGGPPAGQTPSGPPPGMPKIDVPANMPKMPKTPPSPEVQKEVFNFEVEIARKYGLPLNIHCMGGAHHDMMEILKAKPDLTGIAHSFTGDLTMLQDWLDLGFFIAPVLMNPNPETEKIIRAIPEDRLVVETDANPMHSPNGPVEAISVVGKIATIRNTPAEEIGKAATSNLKRLLHM